jgi:hypothetical protein
MPLLEQRQCQRRRLFLEKDKGFSWKNPNRDYTAQMGCFLAFSRILSISRITGGIENSRPFLETNRRGMAPA